MLTTRQQVAGLFGYTHSYFHADLGTVGDAVVFLRTLLRGADLRDVNLDVYRSAVLSAQTNTTGPGIAASCAGTSSTPAG